ncbi:MAG TPA: hypothetical protein VLY45_04115 [Nitrospiria bacterium]|nr:hypothetical protein [Nitrospiria bacterium]
MSRRGAVVSALISVVLQLVMTPSAVPADRDSSREVVRRVCSRCHALQIMGQCVAGSCQGDHVVRLLKPAPWDFAVDWMQSMGARMTPAEQQIISTYLRATFPAEPYPLPWSKVPARFGEGGWNVVTLQEEGDALYAGFEGNGSIYRSDDGAHWRKVAQTGQYTVYGITPFQGALYAGTNDPDPRILKSSDGVHWIVAAQLPHDDHGVISLGVFQGLLYAGTAREWIYRSPDGTHWNKAADLERAVAPAFTHWVRFLIPFRGQLYAGIETGPLYRSADGVAWTRVGEAVTAKTGVRGAAIFAGALYVGTTGGGRIWRSRDGLVWQSVFNAPSHVRRGYVASITVAGETLFAGVDGYVFRTSDGLRWEEVGQLSPTTIEAMAAFRNALYVSAVVPPQAWLYRADLTQ